MGLERGKRITKLQRRFSRKYSDWEGFYAPESVPSQPCPRDHGVGFKLGSFRACDWLRPRWESVLFLLVNFSAGFETIESR